MTMILHDLNAVFVHVPKTAGNFLTRDYLSKFSNDRLVATGHQDGVDRFEVQGDITTHKHMTLAEYAGSMEIRNAYVIATIRDPVERLISAYFSPHRRFRLGTWAKLKSAIAELLNIGARIGPDAYREEDIVMEAGSFAEFVRDQQTYRDYLEGYEDAKGLFLLRKESPLADLNSVLEHLGRQPFDIPQQSQFINKADYRLSDSQLYDCRQIVMDSAHAADYDFVRQLREAALDVSPD